MVIASAQIQELRQRAGFRSFDAVMEERPGEGSSTHETRHFSSSSIFRAERAHCSHGDI